MRPTASAKMRALLLAMPTEARSRQLAQQPEDLLSMEERDRYIVLARHGSACRLKELLALNPSTRSELLAEQPQILAALSRKDRAALFRKHAMRPDGEALLERFAYHLQAVLVVLCAVVAAKVVWP